MTVRTKLTCILLLFAALTRPEITVRTAAAPTADTTATSATPRTGTAVPSESRILEALSRIRFEPNRGQLAGQAEFIGRGAGAQVLLGDSDATIQMRDASIHLTWVRASRRASIAGEHKLPGVVSYLRGSDPAGWLTGLPTYGQLRQAGVYDGIDVVYYGHADGIEFDLAVAPNTDLSQAELAISGASAVNITATGELALTINGQVVTLREPVSFQDGPAGRQPVRVHYVARGGNSVGFRAEAYDASRPLVVDPVIAYSTYKGNTQEDRLWAIATDPAGNIYAGITSNPYTGTTPSAPFDTYIVKFDPQLANAMYTMFYGGTTPSTCRDRISGMVVDASQNAYVFGQTNCTDFPVSGGAFTTTGGNQDVYLTKINPTGTGWFYSAKWGATLVDQPADLAVDPAGNAYVVGRTFGSNYPLTGGVVDSTFVVTEGFLTKINPAGSAALFSTFLGGNLNDTAQSVEVDPTGVIHVGLRTESTDWVVSGGAAQASYGGGTADSFVMGLNSSATGVIYATYLGGSGTETLMSIDIDSSNNVVAVGGSTSTNYPMVAAFQGTYGGGGEDATITKLNGAGAIVFSTYLGGTSIERTAAVAIDSTDHIHVTGPTASAGFPTLNAFQPTQPGGGGDNWVGKLTPGGAPVYLSYLGGSQGTEEPFGIIADGTRVVVAGTTACGTACTANDYPVTPGAHQTVWGGGAASPIRTDGFVTVLLPRTLTLSPAAQTLTVPGPHVVTATLLHEGAPVAGTEIRFKVTGGYVTDGVCTTNGAGQCNFSYTPYTISGVDNIAAWGDADIDALADFDEPRASATITRSYPGGGFGLIEGLVLSDVFSSPIPNATVELRNNAGTLVATDVADEGGYFEFPNMPWGVYRVRTVNVDGFTDEAWDNVVCEPTCSPTAGSTINLNDLVFYDPPLLLRLAPAPTPQRKTLSGTGVHTPGGLAGSFSVNISGPSSMSGSLTYTRNGVTLNSTFLYSMTIDGSTVTIKGRGIVNGKPDYAYVAIFQDGSPKKVSMEIRRPNGTVLQPGALTPLGTAPWGGSFSITPAAP